RQRRTIQLATLKRRQPDQRPRPTRLTTRLTNRLTRLRAQRLRNILRALISQIRRPQQHREPLKRRHLPLHPRRHLSTINSRRRVLNTTHRHRTHHVPVKRRPHLLRRPTHRAAPLAANHHLHHKPPNSKSTHAHGIKPPAPHY